MSAYTIDYTDPLIAGFIIQPGGFDGPGGSSIHSTLRLYGRGTLEWGESVDEDLLRLTESFAGSTAPHHPIGGQMWFQTTFYRHITASGFGAGWYVYNPNTKVWGTITVPSLASLPSSPTIGDYCYLNTGDTGLYRYDQAYKQESATWLPRLFTPTTVAPTTEVPIQSLKVWDAYGNGGAGQWVSPITTAVQATAPSSPHQGDIWYDTSTGHLNVYTGAAWQHLLGPSSGTATVSSANIDANNFAITNLNVTAPLVQGSDGTPTPVSTNKNATDKTYVDAQDSHWGAFTANHYVPIAGTGSIPITGAVVSNNTIQAANFTLTAGGTLLLQSPNSKIDVNNMRIINVTNAPTALTDAVNANYVNTQIATQHTADNSQYLDVAGDTMTGLLYVNGGMTLNSAINANNQRIALVPTSPFTGTDAVNANYVNTQISSALSSALSTNVPVIYTSLGAAKNGDIGIIGATIYIYASGWRKIFPAQWV